MTDWINRCHFGDVRDVLRQMIADGVKVNCIVTSPPYWGLRSYLPADHADKPLEIGSEPTLKEFIATMTEVFMLAREVLADDGTCWINMGDCYATGAGKQVIPGGGTQGERFAGIRGGGEQKHSRPQVPDKKNPDARVPIFQPNRMPQKGLKPKDLCGQPWRLAFALQDAGWWLRQDIIWSKTNGMPESIEDRFTKSHEYLFLMSKSERYYFDFMAVKEPCQSGPSDLKKMREALPRIGGKHKELIDPLSIASSTTNVGQKRSVGNGEMRTRRTVWSIGTAVYKGAHFATFPPALIEPCILAGCPPGGTVLDIFMGSGTTAQVAEQLGRRWIGIDIDRRNEALQRERLRQPSLDLEAA